MKNYNKLIGRFRMYDGKTKFTYEELENISIDIALCNEELYWDLEFSIPKQLHGFSEVDYPIGETLLMLRGPDSQIVTFLKIDDDEYQYVYSYLD